MSESLRVLLLEDDANDAELILHELRQAGYALDWRRVETEAEYLACLDPAPDLILADYSLPQFDAIEALTLLRERGLEIPFLVVSGVIGEEIAVSVMKQGAADYLLKDRLARLGQAVAHALEQKRLGATLREHRAKAEAFYRLSQSLMTFENLSEVLQAVADGVAEALPANRTSLILFDLERGAVTDFVRGGQGTDKIVTVSYGELWEGLSGWALRERQAALSPKGRPDPRESQAVQQRRAETECGAILVAPLLYRGHLLGTVTAINRPEERDFTSDDVELMLAMANQAATTIENVRLIHSLRQTADTLERTTAELRAIVEAHPDLHFRLDESGIILDNKAGRASNLYVPPSVFLGKKMQEVLPPDVGQQFDVAIRQVQKTDAMVSIEYTLPIQGTERFFEARLAPMLPANIFVVVRDITERKAAEAALLNQNARLREQANLLALSHDAILVRDLQDAITFWNNGAAWKYGWTEEEVQGQITHTLLQTRFPVSWEQITQTLYTLGRWEGELIHTRRDGTEIVVESRQALLRNEQGEPIAVMEINRDITERKRMDAALRESEARSRATFEMSADGIITIDERGIVQAFNPAATRLFGYEAREVVGQNIAMLMPEPHRSEHDHHLARYRQTGEKHIIGVGREVVGRRKDGALFPMDLTVGEMNLQRRRMFVGSLRDITARKRAEEALQKAHDELEMRVQERTAALQASEAQLRLVLDTVPAGVVYVDREERYRFSNRRYTERFGLLPEDIVGKRVEEVFGSAAYQTIRPHVATALQGQAITYEAAIPYQNLGLRFMHVDYAPERDAAGEVPGFVVMVNDFTERREMEEALRKSEERFRATFAQAAVGIAHVAFDGAWLRVNQKLCDIVGYSREELMRMTFQDITHPDDLEADLGLLRRLLAEEIPTYQMQKRYFRKDGALIWIHLTVALARDADGRPEYCISVVEDITERKHIEDELRQAHALLEQRVQERTAELRRSNAELQQFAYVASHDLQEPLRMVGSYTQLLARRYQGRLDEKADQYIAYAVDGVTRMQALIHDLLTYSRVGTDRREWQRTDCEKVLADVLANLKIAISESGATIHHDPLPTIFADGTQLASLLQNLIGNALKYCGDKPPRIYIAATQMGQEWCFAVKDDGIGIEPQFSERIFVIFQRLHSRAEYPGTGIGLAICKKIVERHGGRIWLESEPGQGATFFFTLPIIEAEQEKEGEDEAICGNPVGR